MSDETLEREVLSHVTSDRRLFIMKYVLGPAFAAPVIASFFMRSPSGHAMAFTSNSCYASNSTPTVPTDKKQCKKGGWQHLIDSSGHCFTSEKDCENFIKSQKPK